MPFVSRNGIATFWRQVVGLHDPPRKIWNLRLSLVPSTRVDEVLLVVVALLLLLLVIDICWCGSCSCEYFGVLDDRDVGSISTSSIWF